MFNTAFLDIAIDEPEYSSNIGLVIGIVLVVIVAVAAVFIVRNIRKRKNK